ncbi:MAG TPA: PaaI family thioesterase [Nocardioides sp.]|nr:PaaI family thioesterase [Nocardioides sp.]
MNWHLPSDDPAGENVEVEHEARVWRPLADATRELVDLCVMSDVDEDEVRAAQADVEAAVARLRKVRREQTLGQELLANGRRLPWGNPVTGLRNPIAPPLDVRTEPDGRAEADFHCGPAYEGPPGLVHGGVVSLVLDQVLGHSVGAAGRPGMTGTLTIVYRRGTPLGDLRVESWVERREGIKTWARAQMIGPDGVTAEADGVFILPRALRGDDA